MSPRIEVLVFEGCPHAEAALVLARDVAAKLAPESVVERVMVETEDEARVQGFLGSPSIRIDGVDVEGRSTTEGRLACRTYEAGEGVPPRWRIEATLLAALAPRGVLFLCVANSARSQMAEAVARSLAPEGVLVFSAGSKPTEVRDEARRVLDEVGITSVHQYAKSVDTIAPDVIDTVITLCAEEECPVFLGRARRVHWGLADPAAVSASAEARLDAFREVRDELRRRLEVIWPARP